MVGGKQIMWNEEGSQLTLLIHFLFLSKWEYFFLFWEDVYPEEIIIFYLLLIKTVLTTSGFLAEPTGRDDGRLWQCLQQFSYEASKFFIKGDMRGEGRATLCQFAKSLRTSVCVVLKKKKERKENLCFHMQLLEGFGHCWSTAFWGNTREAFPGLFSMGVLLRKLHMFLRGFRRMMQSCIVSKHVVFTHIAMDIT